MKKSLAFVGGILLMLFLMACGAETSEVKTSEVNNSKAYEDSSQTIAEEALTDTRPTITEANGVLEEQNKNGVLIVYFSRFGNTEYPDNIDASTSASIVIDNNTFGTTEYLAGIIQEGTGGDLHLIRTQKPYPADFDELREQNHSEMDEEYLPPLMESNLDMSQYDMVFIGYPVWAADVPQVVLSFLNEYDLSEKTVIPFCTHDGYGAGNSYSTIREVSHAAESPEGLAIEAKDVRDAADTVAAWLENVNITKQENRTEDGETAITITIGEIVLDGVIYDTALAQEIKDKLPLTISMVSYGGREYYGGVDFYPENLEGGQRTFENGDITYCEAHHNMAIFYAQTDNPNLSVEVIPIGKVTSDLSVFNHLDSQEEITFSLAE